MASFSEQSAMRVSGSFLSGLSFISFPCPFILHFTWIGYEKRMEISIYCISHDSHSVWSYISREAKLVLQDILQVLCRVGGSYLSIYHRWLV